jgi:Cu/Zn superoxide dismutase
VTINETTEYVGLSGTATMTVDADTITVVIELMGCTEGDTFFSMIHENGECGADGQAAGMHWAGEGGGPGLNGESLGMDGYTCEADGTATFMGTTTTAEWGEGASDVIGRALMVHGEQYGGPRVACGIVEAP